jgi:hypothetical protein
MTRLLIVNVFGWVSEHQLLISNAISEGWLDKSKFLSQLFVLLPDIGLHIRETRVFSEFSVELEFYLSFIAMAVILQLFSVVQDYLEKWIFASSVGQDHDWYLEFMVGNIMLWLQLCSLFAWLISHQPAVLFSQNKPATNNQPAVLFSQNKPAPVISHQPNERAWTLILVWHSCHELMPELDIIHNYSVDLCQTYQGADNRLDILSLPCSLLLLLRITCGCSTVRHYSKFLGQTGSNCGLWYSLTHLSHCCNQLKLLLQYLTVILLMHCIVLFPCWKFL